MLRAIIQFFNANRRNGRTHRFVGAPLPSPRVMRKLNKAWAAWGC